MTNYCVFQLILISAVYCLETQTGDALTQGCSNGLVQDLIKQMVAEQIERQKILNEFRQMKTELMLVKQELKDRNTQLLDTQFLQKKLERKVIKLAGKLKTSSIAEIQKAINALRSNEKRIKAEINNTKILFGEMTTNSSKMFELLQNDVSDLQNKSSDGGPKIAFTVLLQSQITTSSTIVFKQVITNIGGGYNSSDGMFYCPIAGLYMFTVTLVASERTSVEGYLVKNNVQLARIHEHIGYNYYPSSSLTMALKLDVGDRVWVKGGGNMRYYGSDNSFTGVLIKH